MQFAVLSLRLAERWLAGLQAAAAGDAAGCRGGLRVLPRDRVRHCDAQQVPLHGRHPRVAAARVPVLGLAHG